MATAKKTAAKKAASAAKSAPKSAPASVAATMGATTENLLKPLRGMADRLQNMQLAGGAGKLLESSRKDLQALVEANEKSYKGLQTVVARQTEMIRNAVTEWQSTVKSTPGMDPRENMAKLDELGRAAFKQALEDIRELAELAAKSQADAFEVVRQRVKDNVDEVTKLLQRK